MYKNTQIKLNGCDLNQFSYMEMLGPKRFWRHFVHCGLCCALRLADWFGIMHTNDIHFSPTTNLLKFCKKKPCICNGDRTQASMASCNRNDLQVGGGGEKEITLYARCENGEQCKWVTKLQPQTHHNMPKWWRSDNLNEPHNNFISFIFQFFFFERIAATIATSCIVILNVIHSRSLFPIL